MWRNALLHVAVSRWCVCMYNSQYIYFKQNPWTLCLSLQFILHVELLSKSGTIYPLFLSLFLSLPPPPISPSPISLFLLSLFLLSLFLSLSLSTLSLSPLSLSPLSLSPLSLSPLSLPLYLSPFLFVIVFNNLLHFSTVFYNPLFSLSWPFPLKITTLIVRQYHCKDGDLDHNYDYYLFYPFYDSEHIPLINVFGYGYIF